MDRLTQFFRSFRTLVLIATLAVPMLLWPRVSFAYFPATLSPVFLGVTQDNYPYDGCFGGGVYTTDPQYVQCGNTVAYAYATQVSGTVPLVLAASADDGCFGGGSYTIYPQYGVCRFVAYVYPTQVPGTVPLYWSSDDPFCCGGLTINPGTYATLIAYVYPAIPAPTTFTVYPKYSIGSVIYVPPGAGSSSIAYGNGTVTGTTISTTNSWSREESAGVQIGTKENFLTVTFGNTFGGQTTHSVDMQTTSNSNTTYRAPTSDTINHDYDQILIFLGVQVNVSVDYLGKITWSTDFSHIAERGFAETGYPISVGCLRPNSTIPASQCTGAVNLLSTAGITSADYPNMLGANPFADPSASPVPNHNRYSLIESVFYLPDPTATTFTYGISNNNTTTNAETTSYSYSVSAGVSLEEGTLKVSDKFTWTNSSTLTNKSGTTDSSTFTLSMPSFAYTGPTTLFVYQDTIYKTFMFSFSH